MLLIMRRFRLSGVRLALPSKVGALVYRFHEPFDAETGAYVPAGPEGPRQINVRIFPSESAPNDPGAASGDAILEASVEADPPAEVRSYFEAFSGGRFPEGVTLPPEVFNHFGAIKAGEQMPAGTGVSHLWMTGNVEVFLDGLQNKLVDYAIRVAGLFRWAAASYNTDGRIYVADLGEMRWSLDGAVLRPILPQVQMTIRAMAPPVVPGDQTTESVQRLGQLAQSAPIADDIMRESWTLRDRNPRAAVVLAMSATEAGFRHLVADLVPGAQYIIEELQTPPLTQLLRHYLPKLPVRSNPTLVILPKTVMRRLDNATQLRNRIVHKGAVTPDEGAVDEALGVASDLLRLFDYYAGNAWALAFVSEEVSRELSSP